MSKLKERLKELKAKQDAEKPVVIEKPPEPLIIEVSKPEKKKEEKSPKQQPKKKKQKPNDYLFRYPHGAAIHAEYNAEEKMWTGSLTIGDYKLNLKHPGIHWMLKDFAKKWLADPMNEDVVKAEKKPIQKETKNEENNQ